MELNKRSLARLGIEFDTVAETDRFIRLIREEIEVRVGERIAEGKTSAQMKEFERCNDLQAEKWLEKNCPNYRQMICSVENEMKAELRKYRKKIAGAHSPCIFSTPLNQVGLSVLTFDCLRNAGMKTIGDAIDREDCYVPGLGRNGRRELTEKLDQFLSQV